MRVLRYENSLADFVNEPVPTVLLAGPTVRGHQPHLTSWRFAAIEEFERQRFDGVLVVPEFTDKRESDKGKLWIPLWEFAGLSGCDCVLFWVPRTCELIGLTTNHEHGYWLARMREKMVYGRPDDSYRNTYLDLMWRIDAEQNGRELAPIYTTLEQTVEASIVRAKFSFALNGKRRSYRVQSRIRVESPYGAF